MKGVSKNVIVAAVLLVLITAGGGFGWYWVSDQIANLQEERTKVLGQIVALESKVYSPKKNHLDLIKENDAELVKLLDGFKAELAARDSQFDSIRVKADDGAQRGLDPDDWKKMFSNIREQLTRDAVQAKVKIPADYDFSFSAYRLSLPSGGITLPLGIQLLGVEKLAQILVGTKVISIDSIKRADVEARGSGGGSSKEASDIFSASVLNGSNNLYKVYPFAVTFVCLPEALTEIVNKVESAELLFVIRNVSVENEKQTTRLASQVKAAASNNASSPSASDAPAKAEKLAIPELGQENIMVKLYVDLLYLTLDNAAGEKKPAARQEPKP